MNYRHYKFTVIDFAAFFGMEVEAVRKALQRNKFKPNSLESIVEYRENQQNKRRKQAARETRKE